MALPLKIASGFGVLGGIEIPNHKYQTNHNDQNSKSQTQLHFGRRIPNMFGSLDIGI
jgi:hypothetical protein